MAFWGWDQVACRHAFEGSGVGLKFANVIVVVRGQRKAGIPPVQLNRTGWPDVGYPDLMAQLVISNL